MRLLVTNLHFFLDKQDFNIIYNRMGYFFPLVLIFLPLKTEKPLINKTLLFVIAHKDFKDEEYQVPRNIFERLGAKVTVASSDTGIAVGTRGLKVKIDTLISQIDTFDFDGLVFVGGMGAKEYWDSEVAHRIAKSAARNGKVIAAICIAPVILARAGVLRWKEATVWASPKTKHILKQEKIEYIPRPVVVSEKIVTANGPIAAKQFGEEIVRLLLKENESSDTESNGSGVQN